MSITIPLAGSSHVSISEETVEASPPDELSFTVKGTISANEALLAKFSGRTLTLTRIDLSVTDSQTVSVDLVDEATLRLETVDVGVETPDAADVASGVDSVTSPVDDSDDADEWADARTGGVAFTVEGIVRDVPAETCEVLSGCSPTLNAITFGVEDAAKGDGGKRDVIVEFKLLGYRVVVHRDGTVDVGTGGGVPGL